MISRKLWLRLLVGGVAATLLLTLPLLFLQVHHDATLDPQIGRALRSANRARKKTTQPYAKKVEPHDSSRAQDARIVRAPTHRLSDASRQAAASLATAGTDIRSSGRWVANSSKFSSKGTLQYEANQNVLPRAHAISSTARLASAHSEQIKQQRVQPRQRTGHTRTADAVGKTALLPSEVPRVDRPVVESASNVPNTTQVSDGGNKVAEDTGDVDKTLILQNGSATESPTDQIRPGYNVSARELASSTRKWLSYMQAVFEAAQRAGLNRSQTFHLLPSGSQWKKKCRRFKVGARKDYQTSIKLALLSLNLCETTTEHWDVFWGDQWLDLGEFTSTQRLRSRPSMVNSIPGFKHSFGDKVAFARLFEDCFKRKRTLSPKLQCDWTKRGFNIGRQGDQVRGLYQDLRLHALSIAEAQTGSRNDFPQLWILKPQRAFNQFGISMIVLNENDVADDGSLVQWLHRVVPDGSWTLQEYVKHPLLYRGRKFDLRVWAAISSIQPLRIYMLTKAFPKISSRRYDPSVDVVGEHCLAKAECACMHVRMPGGENCGGIELLPKPYPPHTATTLFQRGLGFGPNFVGRGEPGEQYKIWDKFVLPQIQRILATVVLLAREEPLRLHKELLNQGAFYRRVLLLSPDFIVDEAGKVFLEEVNTNGFLVGDDELFKGQQDTVDLMRLLGADGWPMKNLYMQQLSALVDRFCEEQGYDEHDMRLVRPALLDGLHEEVAAYPTSWLRIFPSQLNFDHEELMDQDESFSTDLDAVVFDFLRWRVTRLRDLSLASVESAEKTWIQKNAKLQ